MHGKLEKTKSQAIIGVAGRIILKWIISTLMRI
jgi:hypothetical protein